MAVGKLVLARAEVEKARELVFLWKQSCYWKQSC